MHRKIVELRILKAILALSKAPGRTETFAFVSDLMLDNITKEESEKFTRIAFEYPGFKELYEEPRTGKFYPEMFDGFPENTLGFHYAKFIRDNHLTVDWYPDIKELSPLHFARTRQFQTHDILHTITGFNITVMNEIALQGFYSGQAALNTTAMVVYAASAIGLLQRSEPEANTELMDHIMTGYTMGKKAERMIFRKWEDDWHKDISILRKELGVTPFAGITG